MMTPFQQGKQFFCDCGPHALDISGNPYDLKSKSYQEFEDGFFDALRDYQRDLEFEEAVNEADWVLDYLEDR